MNHLDRVRDDGSAQTSAGLKNTRTEHDRQSPIVRVPRPMFDMRKRIKPAKSANPFECLLLIQSTRAEAAAAVAQRTNLHSHRQEAHLAYV